MTTISIRLDDEMKQDLDEMCDEMGINLTTFFMIYAKRALRDRRIPFDVSAPADPFYSSSNLRQLEKASHQIRQGKTVTFDLSQLEAMANE